ncbi:TetR/AcrR family transcriptional regulator [Arthrobacter sp. H35-D1]|uniref:TetR/AcrR family transcriptional regulator n=1 Tax=Arthrobacter sp. H35-D1 TaxID=3046202 RepID=UPI0024B9F705|nr:TetR/AcrR family transcriptional regulator [Arthrobacter sp. H35-D1]MDJ0314709.1 TetR/AcrR family transcriptional regulator [Arthrobacter sp. H35-D1]
MNILQREPASASKSSEQPATPQENPAAVDGRSARWDAHREERRRDLIKVARRAIHRLGPDASMDDIAATAGTSKSVFYRYFGDKSGLRQAVGSVVIRQMQETIAAARQAATDPKEGVTAMVAAYLHMAQTSPNVYSFATLAADGDTRQSGELNGFFESVTAMITEPLRNLLGDPASPLLGYWPTAAIGLVRSAGELWLQAPDDASKPDSTAMAEQISAWLFDGVGHHVPTPAPIQ